MDRLPEVSKATGREIKIEPSFKPVVLAVEDQERVRDTTGRVLQVILREMSGESDVAVNGEKALEMWKNGRYNILLTDFNMPGKSGIDLAKEIKKISPNAVVILMSSKTGLDEQKLSENGIDFFLPKPFTHQELSGLLREIIKRQNNTLVRGDLLSNDQSKD